MSQQLKVPCLKLYNGLQLPMVGLGTYKTDKEPAKLANAIKEAVGCGYRHIDCAYAYENEQVIGKALKEALAENNLKREDIFVADKLWNSFHSKEAVLKAVDVSLKNLQLDYFDLYLIHWPMGYAENGSIFPTNQKGELLVSDVHYIDTYKAMELLVESGKAKSIGVSNFNLHQLQDVLNSCKIKPAVLQIEVHPYFQNTELIEFCHKNDIAVTAYSPLGAADRSWLKPDDPVLLKDEVVGKLAKKYNKTPGQILLRWNTQNNVSVIPKSVTPSRIEENLNIFDFKLNNEDMQLLKKLDRNFRYYSCDEAKSHKFYPFK